MGELQKRMVSHLVALSSKDKREIGDRIVLALGGDPTVRVTDLPPRRGPGDGGIDGRIPIIVRQRTITQKIKRMPDGTSLPYIVSESPIEELETEGAFQIKIEASAFDRYELNAFVEDMRREGMYAGVIVSAAGLSPDAEHEFERHNRGDMDLCHITLEALLSNRIGCRNIRFVHGNLEARFKESLRRFLSRSTT